MRSSDYLLTQCSVEAHECTQMPLMLDLSFMALYITAADSLHVAQDVTTTTAVHTHTHTQSHADTHTRVYVRTP